MKKLLSLVVACGGVALVLLLAGLAQHSGSPIVAEHMRQAQEARRHGARASEFADPNYSYLDSYEFSALRELAEALAEQQLELLADASQSGGYERIRLASELLEVFRRLGASPRSGQAPGKKVDCQVAVARGINGIRNLMQSSDWPLQADLVGELQSEVLAATRRLEIDLAAEPETARPDFL